MMKRLLLLFVVLGFIGFTTACSSSKTDEEDGSPEAEASAELGEDADFEEGDEEGDEFADEEGEDEGDEFADEEGEDEGDEFAEEDGEEFEEEGEEFAEEEGDASEEVALEESTEEPSGEELAAGETDEQAFQEPMSEDMGEEPVRSWVPVKKIADTPFTKAGVLVNAVYLARPGDDVESISQKIYGSSDKAEELYSVNTTLRSRGVKTGDKVYYNSPQRPSDDSRLLVFYEDVGLQPESYVSQAGDNIREVSKSLLGDDSSWKEVWATNMDVESKTVIPEGTTLRYWSGSATSTVASTPPPMNEPAPPPPPTDMAANDIPPPPPPPPGGTMGGVEPPPPPPPPAPGAKQATAKKGGTFGSDPDETMALGAAAIVLLAAAALIIMIRKRKQRQALADFANTQTHTQIE